MSDLIINSTLFEELSTEKQQLLSGGQGRFDGDDDDDFRRGSGRDRYRRCLRRCFRFCRRFD